MAEERARTKRSLEEAMNAELYGIKSYLWTFVGCASAVPLGLYGGLAPKYKLAPLLLLGLGGSLADAELGRRRAQPFMDELDRLRKTDAAQLRRDLRTD